MGLKFNSINIKLTQPSKSFSHKANTHRTTSTKSRKVKKLTFKSKAILKQLGFNLK